MYQGKRIMNIGDFLKGLKIDRWYKVFIYLGGLAFVISLFIEVKGVTNLELQMLSLGFFFIGIGEWKNEKILVEFKPPNVYTGTAALIETPIRKPDFIGVLFDVIGVILFLCGLGHIIWSFFSQS